MTAYTALAARRQCEWCEWQFTESKATRRSTQSVHTVTVSVRNVSRWYLRMPTSAVDYSAPGRERGYMDQTPLSRFVVDVSNCRVYSVFATTTNPQHIEVSNGVLLRPIVMSVLSVRVCVCLCISASISPELHVQSSPNFLGMLPKAVARCFFELRCVTCFQFIHTLTNRPTYRRHNTPISLVSVRSPQIISHHRYAYFLINKAVVDIRLRPRRCCPR